MIINLHKQFAGLVTTNYAKKTLGKTGECKTPILYGFMFVVLMKRISGHE